MVSTIVIYIIGVAVFTVLFAQIVNWIMQRAFKRIDKDQKTLAGIRLEPYEERATKFAVVRRLVVFLIHFIGLAMIVLALPAAKHIAISMLAGAGVAAIIIGFAVQKSFANIISGIMIAFQQPFRIGDKVEFKGHYATVEDIGLSYTTLKSWNNKRIVIPNSVIADEIIENFSIDDPKMARPLEFSVSYNTDIDKARKIMIDALKRHPDFYDNRGESDIQEGKEVANVYLTQLGDSSMTLRMVFWATSQPVAWRMEQELREEIKNRFDKSGIEIPFPQRVIHTAKAAKPIRKKTVKKISKNISSKKKLETQKPAKRPKKSPKHKKSR